MTDEKKLTTREKREKKIEQIEAKLQKLKALQAKETRKERNGELIAWGVFIESRYRQADYTQRQSFKAEVEFFLEGRTLAAAMRGFDRLDAEIESLKTSTSTVNDSSTL